MLLDYFLAFCRLVVGFVFLASFVSKVISFPSLVSTVTAFRVLPASYSRLIASLVLAAELGVVSAMALGGQLLSTGFLLAILLLSGFTLALVSILVRKIDTSCNCFGESHKKVSGYDIVRNLAFLVCAVAGYAVRATLGPADEGPVSLIVWALLAGLAALFVGMGLSLREIVQVLRVSK